MNYRLWVPFLVRHAAIGYLTLIGLPVASAADGPPVGVVTIDVQPIVQLIEVTGTVTAPQAATLSTSVGALIESYRVDIGDQVAAGQRLVQLDGELAEFALEGARAGELEARTEFDDARRRLAEAERLAGERGLVAVTEVESRRAEVAASTAALAVSEAATRQQQAVVARHAIRAPFAGVVSERLAEAGEWVSPGDPLLRLVGTSSLQFDFRLPQDVFAVIPADAPATVSFDALPGFSLPGRVQAVVPVSDPRDRTFLMRVVAATDAGLPEGTRVLPGMSARAVVTVNTGRRSVVVPRDSLLRNLDGGTSVWVVQREDSVTVVRERRVATGLEFNGMVEISSGLEPRLQVVVRGNESLRDGQPVEIR